MIRWPQKPVRISRLTPAGGDDFDVSAEVEGAKVWFRSPDVRLRACPTAFASAFVVAARHHGRSLTVAGPVSARWRSGVDEVGALHRDWWGYPVTRIRATGAGVPDPTPRPRRALTFTGGVDSFYTLLHGGPVDRIVYVRGYDIPMDDQRRWLAFRETLGAVAAAVNATPIVLETNLREHPFFGPVNWERTHGGALAAVGHLLAGEIGALRIAATLTDEFQPAWGSHPRTDPLWSSESVEIEQHGTEIWRHEKLWAIQDEPLVRDHLRVCWENRSPTGNCSRCDKCLITMLALQVTGRLACFPVFDPPRSFAEALDALPRTTFRRTSAILAERAPGDDVRDALTRLRERTEARS